MAAGAFVISYIKDSTNRTVGINFKIKLGVTQVPADQTALVMDIERVIATLNALFPNGGQRFDLYMEDAFSLSNVGLVGECAHTQTAARALVSLKETVLTNEAGRVKNSHLINLGKWGLTFAAVAVLLGMFTHWLAILDRQPEVRFALLGQFCYAWAGAMAGTWVSYGWRKAAFTFEDLGKPEADYLWSSIRLIFTGLQTVIIGLLLVLGIVNVSFGQITTAAFAHSVEMALLVGLLCGFSEQTLPSIIAKQATKLLGTPVLTQPQAAEPSAPAAEGQTKTPAAEPSPPAATQAGAGI